MYVPDMSRVVLEATVVPPTLQHWLFLSLLHFARHPLLYPFPLPLPFPFTIRRYRDGCTIRLSRQMQVGRGIHVTSKVGTHVRFSRPVGSTAAPCNKVCSFGSSSLTSASAFYYVSSKTCREDIFHCRSFSLTPHEFVSIDDPEVILLLLMNSLSGRWREIASEIGLSTSGLRRKCSKYRHHASGRRMIICQPPIKNVHHMHFKIQRKIRAEHPNPLNITHILIYYRKHRLHFHDTYFVTTDVFESDESHTVEATS